MSERIEFKTNIPTTITLAFPKGKNVPSKFGSGTQTMLTDRDGRVAFVPAFVGARIAGLKLQPGSILQIVKTERVVGKKGFDWNVRAMGEQADGTFTIPKEKAGSPPPGFEPAGPSTTSSSGTNSIAVQHSTRASLVEQHARRLIDLQASLSQYATRHNGAVSSADVRSILLSVYIQSQRGVRA